MSGSVDKKEVEIDDKDSFDMEAFMGKLEGNSSPVTQDFGKHKDVAVRKATAPQLLDIVDLLKYMIKSSGLSGFDEESLQTFAESIKDDPDIMFDIFTQNYDRAMNLITALCSLSKDEVDNLDLDYLMALVTCEWKVNETFFIQRIMPMLRRLIPSLNTGQ